MNRTLAIAAAMIAGAFLSGCAVVSLGAAAVDVGVTAASTAVGVTTDVAGAAAGTVTGSGKDDKDNKDKD
jgi:hypothetical protein